MDGSKVGDTGKRPDGKAKTNSDGASARARGDAGVDGKSGEAKGKNAWKDRRGKGGGRRGGWGRNRDRPYDRQDGDGYQGKRCTNGKRERRTRNDEASAEVLHSASLAQKGEKVIVFDCGVRPKAELTNWIRHFKPSVVKRSDGIGSIAIVSDSCSSLAEERFAVGREDAASHEDLLREWESLTTDPTATLQFGTLQALARKHGVCGGRWIFSVFGGLDVDDVWMFVCSAVASLESKMPCLGAMITPVQDLEDACSRGSRNCHMVTVSTGDFADESNVFAVEKALRKIPIKHQLTYKPQLFSVLGIYRNNKFKLRPIIYSSDWHHGSNSSVIDNSFSSSWSYRGGSGDLRIEGAVQTPKEEPENASDADPGKDEEANVTSKGDAQSNERSSDEDTLTGNEEHEADSKSQPDSSSQDTDKPEVDVEPLVEAQVQEGKIPDDEAEEAMTKETRDLEIERAGGDQDEQKEQTGSETGLGDVDGIASNTISPDSEERTASKLEQGGNDAEVVADVIPVPKGPTTVSGIGLGCCDPKVVCSPLAVSDEIEKRVESELDQGGCDSEAVADDGCSEPEMPTAEKTEQGCNNNDPVATPEPKEPTDSKLVIDGCTGAGAASDETAPEPDELEPGGKDREVAVEETAPPHPKEESTGLKHEKEESDEPLVEGSADAATDLETPDEVAIEVKMLKIDEAKNRAEEDSAVPEDAAKKMVD